MKDTIRGLANALLSEDEAMLKVYGKALLDELLEDPAALIIKVKDIFAEVLESDEQCRLTEIQAELQALSYNKMVEAGIPAERVVELLKTNALKSFKEGAKAAVEERKRKEEGE